jgi:hypothetical protein
MRTAGWLSAAVVKIWLSRAGMIVLRSMSIVMTPPVVSMPEGIEYVRKAHTHARKYH